MFKNYPYILEPTHICELPARQGTPDHNCDIATYRFWYNKDSNKCETVTDYGCNRTQNSFKTEEECKSACVLE